MEKRRFYEIQARQGQRVASLRVSADRFKEMTWAADTLGARAILMAGQSTRDHARAAIQFLSTDIRDHRVYTHLGWRKTGGLWVYLHAGGAIGANGIEPDIEVSVLPTLERYHLPPPPTGIERQQAIKTSLTFLNVAPHVITFLLYALPWRAILGQTDFSLFLAGRTGMGKTELAALIQQYFGAEFDARHLPGNWLSTANSLADLAFLAKDTVLIVDDYCPTGSLSDRQRYDREADRLLRGVGNAAGRQRMRSDGTLRPERPPRCTILSTGEDVPRGHSLRARTAVINVSQGNVRWPILTQCQQHAANGVYAQVLSAFVQWVAPQYETLQAKVRQYTRDLRSQIVASHRRTADVVASLAAGFRIFLDFAVEAEALTPAQAHSYQTEMLRVCQASTAVQAQHQADSDPAQCFLELISAALSSGRAHLADPKGHAPVDSATWGWGLNPQGMEPLAKGEKIGWLEEPNVYLEPDVAFAIAQKLARDQGESLPVSEQTLRKRLNEKGFLASIDHASQTLLVRRQLEGQQHRVLHLHVDTFRHGLSFPSEPSNPAYLLPTRSPSLSRTKPPRHNPAGTHRNPANPTEAQQAKTKRKQRLVEKMLEMPGYYSQEKRNRVPAMVEMLAEIKTLHMLGSGKSHTQQWSPKTPHRDRMP
ncbi:MAG: hypothetical protein AB7G75_10945 [Candidatus Binatia bacterium]